jgi:hypothetical protein
MRPSTTTRLAWALCLLVVGLLVAALLISPAGVAPTPVDWVWLPLPIAFGTVGAFLARGVRATRSAGCSVAGAR